MTVTKLQSLIVTPLDGQGNSSHYTDGKTEAHFTLLRDRSEYGRNDIQTLNWYVNKFYNLDEMDKFIEIYKTE